MTLCGWLGTFLEGQHMLFYAPQGLLDLHHGPGAEDCHPPASHDAFSSCQLSGAHPAATDDAVAAAGGVEERNRGEKGGVLWTKTMGPSDLSSRVISCLPIQREWRPPESRPLDRLLGFNSFLGRARRV